MYGMKAIMSQSSLLVTNRIMSLYATRLLVIEGYFNSSEDCETKGICLICLVIIEIQKNMFVVV